MGLHGIGPAHPRHGVPALPAPWPATPWLPAGPPTAHDHGPAGDAVPPPPRCGGACLRWDEIPWWYPDRPYDWRGDEHDPGPPPVMPPRPAPGDRPLYAVAPIGGPLPARDELPPRPGLEVRAINWFHVTNLGSLLDVLA